MKVGVFSSKQYDRQFLDAANRGRHELRYLACRLTAATAAEASGFSAVCLFANDKADAAAVEVLAQSAVRLIALRAAGFDNVDLEAAHAHGITVARVPSYSPNAVAEHAFALLLSLNRKVHLAYDRIRQGNFVLDGLIGFDLAGKTLGIIGVGNIGSVAAGIGLGFGCRILGVDPVPREDSRGLVKYVAMDDLLEQSDVVTLHCPLTDDTRHLIGEAELARMKPGALLINTSRGACVDTAALLRHLEAGGLGGAALDVYEHEQELFFEDRTGLVPRDAEFAELLACPRVLVTGHMGFLTAEALANIARTTIGNIDAFEQSGRPLFEVN
jgi:D-lactate dehydrogenase